MIATDAHGNELVEVSLGEVPPPDGIEIPLTGALVVVAGTKGVLLVHDVWRDQWELPGGTVERGETSSSAAEREVSEESGQVLRRCERVGWALFRLPDSGQLERADLFYGEIAAERDFEPNDETDAIRWWNTITSPDDVGSIDRELILTITADREK